MGLSIRTAKACGYSDRFAATCEVAKRWHVFFECLCQNPSSFFRDLFTCLNEDIDHSTPSLRRVEKYHFLPIVPPSEFFYDSDERRNRGYAESHLGPSPSPYDFARSFPSYFVEVFPLHLAEAVLMGFGMEFTIFRDEFPQDIYRSVVNASPVHKV